MSNGKMSSTYSIDGLMKFVDKKINNNKNNNIKCKNKSNNKSKSYKKML